MTACGSAKVPAVTYDTCEAIGVTLFLRRVASAQSLAEELPDVDVVPAGQGVHLVARADSEYVLAGQGLQDDPEAATDH